MSILTRIRAGSNDPTRCNLYVDGEFYMAIPAEGVVNYGLKVGQEIPSDLLEELAQYDQYQRVMQKAMDYLSRRPYCVQELTRKLAEKDFDQDTAQQVCQMLEERGYIDEEAVAQQFYEHLRAKGFGPLRIGQELQKRGIPRHLVQQVLEQEQEEDREADIRAIIEKKLRFAPVRDEKLRRRVMDQLSRSGYRYGEVSHLVAEYFEGFEDEGEEL